MRIYLAVALSVGLALAGHATVQMRGMSDPAGQMVLCTGSGPVTVYIDENGQPTAPPHYCPDCLTHLMVALVGADHPGVSAPVQADIPFEETDALVLGSSPRQATARSPPASV